MQPFLLFFVGVLSGPIYDAGYLRPLLITGSFLIPFGFMMTSLCRAYWQLILAQGVCVGLGAGLVYIPSISIIPQYFTERKAFALGLAATGSSIGGIIYPIVFQRLLTSVGFPWATRVLGFLSAATLTVALVLLKNRLSPTGNRTLFDSQALRTPSFILYCLATTFSFMGFLIPGEETPCPIRLRLTAAVRIVFFIQSYSLSRQIASEDLIFYLLPILNGASTLGRLLPNFVADKTGGLNLLIPLAIASGVISFCIPTVRTPATIIAASAAYGFVSGALVSLSALPIVRFTDGKSDVGTWMGMCYFLVSFGLLTATPAAGAIWHEGDDYAEVFFFAGALLVASAVLLIATRIYVAGVKLRMRV